MSRAVLPQVDLNQFLAEVHQGLPPSTRSLTVSGNAIPDLVTPDVMELETTVPKILIVDDEPINIRVITKYLHELGYTRCTGLSDSRQALSSIALDTPDLVILDVMMPFVSGIEILAKLRANSATAHLPVLVLTAAVDRETRLAVLESGATDFLNKPIDPSELSPRVRNALTVKKLHDSLRHQAQNLEIAVRMRTAELEASRQDIIHCLARAAEFRDDDTGQHVLRVGRYAGIIAQAMGMSPSEVDQIRQAAQLHDIGKIGIPDSILLKPGKLEPDEFERMQKHTSIGKRVIERFPQHEWDELRKHVQIGAQILDIPRSPVLQMAARIALTHHEWWDGNGYPLGLAGEDIPLEGRITAVADVFDALSSKRPYKRPFPREKCFQIIAEERGTHFDPQVVDAFFSMRDEIVKIQIELADADLDIH
ncbi:MAG: HD domain-containing phosphohydrolase [Planctomycetota bacterium]